MNERIRELAFQSAGGLLRFDERGFMLYEDELEKFAELVRADEREACAKIVEADGLARGDEGLVLIKAAGRIRARGEK